MEKKKETHLYGFKNMETTCGKSILGIRWTCDIDQVDCQKCLDADAEQKSKKR